MSTWDVTIRKIDEIKEHPNAQNLSIASIGGWNCIVRKGEYQSGDLVAYFPESTLIPQEHLTRMGLAGRLSGSEKNRVKTIRLRGEYSIGVLDKAPAGFNEGDSVAEYYGATKYEPFIPESLRGKVRAHHPNFIKYDIENINNYKQLLIDGEEVSISEKIHGTSFSCGIVQDVFYVNSRNITLEETADNVYWKIAREYDLENKIRKFPNFDNVSGTFLHGEIYGPGIQKGYHYGVDKPTLAAFDVRRGQNWLHTPSFYDICHEFNIPAVKELYRGPFSMDMVKDLAAGKERTSGKQLHINEGVVVKPVFERIEHRFGRVFLKYINPEYAVQGDLTEYH